MLRRSCCNIYVRTANARKHTVFTCRVQGVQITSIEDFGAAGQRLCQLEKGDGQYTWRSDVTRLGAASLVRLFAAASACCHKRRAFRSEQAGVQRVCVARLLWKATSRGRSQGIYSRASSADSRRRKRRGGICEASANAAEPFACCGSTADVEESGQSRTWLGFSRARCWSF